MALALLVGMHVGTQQGRRLALEEHHRTLAVVKTVTPQKSPLSLRLQESLERLCDIVDMESVAHAADVYRTSTGPSGAKAGISPSYMAANAFLAAAYEMRLAVCVGFWTAR